VYILKHGLKQIPERAAEGCDVLLSHSVTSVRRKAGGEYVVDVKNLENKRTLIADGIVCATTASVVSRIFSDLTSEQVDFFSSITYSSTAVAAYRVKRSQPTKTYAIAYPRIEKQPIAAMTVLSDVSPVANMIKIYASGSIGKEIIRKSDKEIHNIVTKPLSVDLMTALESGEWRIQRWMEAIPEFNVGHLRKLHSFANGEIETPDARVVFAGDYIGGPFMEGAFTSGIEAAARLHKQFDTI
jgi:oxygen-dependent protoporphyrinogen oxidase